METLSDKSRYGELSSFCIKRTDYFDIEDVKDFIKQLKTNIENKVYSEPLHNMDRQMIADLIHIEINKLAGEKLI